MSDTESRSEKHGDKSYLLIFDSSRSAKVGHEGIMEVLGVVDRWMNHAICRIVGPFVIHVAVAADLSANARRARGSASQQKST